MLKVLLFGASGSAGGAVLRQCLAAPAVAEVRAIVRRPLAVDHPKLRAFRHEDFLDYAAIAEAFAGLDACLYCLGRSISQVSGEAEYRRITVDYAAAAARAFAAASPAGTFHFVSGRGSNAGSRLLWARVKAEAEREVIASAAAVCWRPAAIGGLPSQSEPVLYRALRPVLRLFAPFRSLYVSGADLGRAMLQATRENVRARIVESAEIRDFADRAGPDLGGRASGRP